MIAIVDYGIGNLHSVRKAVAFVGGEAMVTNNPKLLERAEKVILPGVGAFKDGMEGLAASGFLPALKAFAASGKPLLGICLGMQLLFDESQEAGQHAGLGILPGRVRALVPDGIKVPHIGWNQLAIKSTSPILDGVPDGSYVYFNHGFYCQPTHSDEVLTDTEYGRQFASAVGSGLVFGFQFHPEKSQHVGLQLVRNFIAL